MSSSPLVAKYVVLTLFYLYSATNTNALAATVITIAVLLSAACIHMCIIILFVSQAEEYEFQR